MLVGEELSLTQQCALTSQETPHSLESILSSTGSRGGKQDSDRKGRDIKHGTKIPELVKWEWGEITMAL